MTKSSRHTMESRYVFIRRGGGPTALRRLEKAGVKEASLKEKACHIHPRRLRRKFQ